MIREDLEKIEDSFLSPAATRSADTKGRRIPIEKCPLRTDFQRDRDRIIHSKSFRQMKYKTQVFLPGSGDHYRTRLTHTLEVTQIGRTIARGLGLNEDLTEAIGLGHDLGHTPFGHAGERVLDQLMQPEYRFHHNEQSLRVVDILENGKGLNLTYEVRDGIEHHTGDILPSTPEGQIIRFADQIAYVNHDIDDALRIGLLVPGQLPVTHQDFLGSTHGSRINSLVEDLINTGKNREIISLSATGQDALNELRTFLFEHLYSLPVIQTEDKKSGRMIKELFCYYMEHPQEIPDSIPDAPLKIRVKDYIACMTDISAVEQYKKIFIPGGINF